MNETCISCGLHKQCRSNEHWNVQPEVVADRGSYEKLDDRPVRLVIITSRPNEDDVTANHPGPLRSDAGQWMREMADSWNVPYAIDHTLRCYVNEKPKAAHYATCSEHFKEFLERMKPEVILCLGEEAAKAVTGKRGLTFAKLKAGVWDYEGDRWEAKVVVTSHPVNHSAYTSYDRGGRDLRSEYKQMCQTVHAILSGTYVQMDPEYVVVDNPDKMGPVIAELRQGHKLLAYDCETANVSPVLMHPDNELICVGLTSRQAERKYFNAVFYVREWDRASIADLYEAALDQRAVVGTHIKYDLQCSHHFTGGLFEARDHLIGVHDSMFCSWLEDQSLPGNGLEAKAGRHLGIPPWKHLVNGAFDEIRAEIKASKKTHPLYGVELNYGHLPVDFILKYQSMDTWAEARTWFEYYALNPLPPRVQNIYRCMIAAMWGLMDIERTGLYLNIPKMEALRDKMGREIAKFQKWIDHHPFTKLAGLDSLNVKSPTQLSKAATASKIHPTYVSNKTGLACMDKAELKKQAGRALDPEVDDRTEQEWFSAKTPAQKYWYGVQQISQKRNRIGKFINPYIDLSVDSYVKTTYTMTKMEGGSSADKEGASLGIDSGRIASSWPSVHLIIKSADIRDCYEAPPGKYLGETDFTAGEPVVLALVAGVQGFKDIFRKRWEDDKDPNGDLYKVGASKFWKVKVDKVEDTLRKMSKNLNLATIYLQSPESASEIYGIPVEECIRYQDWFFGEFPEARHYVKGVLTKVFHGEMVTTPTGRQASFELYGRYDYDPDVHGDVPFYQLARRFKMSQNDQHACRKAANFVIQGTLSDLGLAQLARFSATFRKKRIDWLRTTNFVHDALWWEVDQDKLVQADHMTRTYMEDTKVYKEFGFELDFPEDWVILRAEATWGTTLANLKELVKFKKEVGII